RMPTAYVIFTRYWKLHPSQAKRLWTALAGSQAPRPCVWRYQILAFRGTGPGSSEHIMETVSRPATMITVMEDLIAEERLTPQEGRQFEEYLLQRTTKQGCWGGRGIQEPLTHKEKRYGDRRR